MRQAILTRWLSMTDHRPTRIKATCAAGSVTLDWDDGLDISANHRAAACALLRKLDWVDWTYHGGVLTIMLAEEY